MLKGQNYEQTAAGFIRSRSIRSASGRTSSPSRRCLPTTRGTLLLFILGINTNLRASDLLRITVGQVRDLKPGDEITLKEKKTGKPRRITLNKACVQAIQRLLASRPYDDADPLFLGQRGPLTVPSVHSTGQVVVPSNQPEGELRQSTLSGRRSAIING